MTDTSTNSTGPVRMIDHANAANGIKPSDFAVTFEGHDIPALMSEDRIDALTERLFSDNVTRAALDPIANVLREALAPFIDEAVPVNPGDHGADAFNEALTEALDLAPRLHEVDAHTAPIIFQRAGIVIARLNELYGAWYFRAYAQSARRRPGDWADEINANPVEPDQPKATVMGIAYNALSMEIDAEMEYMRVVES